jgi:7-cyano-7-deazaguanine synthase
MEGSKNSGELIRGLMKRAVVVHSGGMDSSICLAQAIRDFGPEQVLSLTFSYQQRHSTEIQRARRISDKWGVDHVEVDLSCLNQITENSLTRHSWSIEAKTGEPPNSLVLGRNGLMARLAAVHGHSLGARVIYMGVIDVESSNSGYRDCSRVYMDKMEDILRIDLANPEFEIRTPLVYMTKRETLEFAHRLNVLEFLLEETVTCYQGLTKKGCGLCPACELRNQGIAEYLLDHPELEFSYPT